MTKGLTTKIRSIASHPRAGALAVMVASALAASAAAPTSATADAPPTPAAFALTAVGVSGAMMLHGTAGQVLHGAVRVRDVSRQTITVILQPADIKNAGNGNADYVTSRALAYRPLAASRGRHRRPSASRLTADRVHRQHSRRHERRIALRRDRRDQRRGPRARRTRKGAKGTSFTFYRINRQALPLTIRLPGPLTRSLALRSAMLIVAPVGASLRLALRAGGSELIEAAQLNVRVLRGSRTIFTYASTLGQLFPTTSLNYDVPWQGRPTPGSYRVLGTIRPTGTAPVNIDTTVKFTGANAAQLKRETPAVSGAATNGLPGWVPIALTIATALLIALSLAVYKLARRPARTVE